MNILIISQRYHPFVGGVETQTRLYAGELAKKHTVRVAAANFGSSSLHPKLGVLGDSLLVPKYESYQDGLVPVISLAPSFVQRLKLLPVGLRAMPVLRRHYDGLRKFGYPWYRFAFMGTLRKLIREADVVHCVAGGYLAWTSQLAAAAEGKPFACTPYVHPGGYGDDQDSISYVNRSNAVFALLETDKKMLADLGVDEAKIHLSGVVPLLPESADPSGFRQRHGIGDAPMILYVGRMVDYKGFKALLGAAKSVWQSVPDARFVFIGPGGDSTTEDFHDDEGRILALGKVSEQEKADALAACTIFSMPSHFEILPAVYLEAWSYGKPVIGGTANGLKELVEGNEAGLVSSQDVDELAGKILSLLQNPEGASAMGARGLALVKERYSTESVVNAIERVYNSISE